MECVIKNLCEIFLLFNNMIMELWHSQKKMLWFASNLFISKKLTTLHWDEKIENSQREAKEDDFSLINICLHNN